ncbi:hypothetical protein H8959_022760, partial [Pygathrix nigripes]
MKRLTTNLYFTNVETPACFLSPRTADSDQKAECEVTDSGPCLHLAICSENGLAQKQRTPRRRCQQPKMLSSPEDTMYYNQLNGTLEYQGSKRKPRKLG